jgi:hypothetical protein
MNDTLENCAAVLAEAGFSTRHAEIPAECIARPLEALAFEDSTIIGFVVVYESPAELFASWKSDRDRIAMRHRDALQAARQKAWNAYLVLISRGAADLGELLALGQIEEDLEAMRKITKAGVTGATAARLALLPLLPFRSAPSLEPIDMSREIASRSTEVDADLVEAFLSGAEDGVVMQIIEDRA